ncbi:MAG TPA: hypothetical protein VKE49_11775 [Myxococcaceae bacterium]|nr:hypothetical protein [Myxococcaceae bacterium]
MTERVQNPPPVTGPLPQDASQQPGGDPDLEFGPRAPSMPQYFLGYAVVFAVIVGFALAIVGLMKLLR